MVYGLIIFYTLLFTMFLMTNFTGTGCCVSAATVFIRFSMALLMLQF